MKEHLFEYLRLREHILKLYQRQGQETWTILDQVICDIIKSLDQKKVK